MHEVLGIRRNKQIQYLQGEKNAFKSQLASVQFLILVEKGDFTLKNRLFILQSNSAQDAIGEHNIV